MVASHIVTGAHTGQDITTGAGDNWTVTKNGEIVDSTFGVEATVQINLYNYGGIYSSDTQGVQFDSGSSFLFNGIGGVFSGGQDNLTLDNAGYILGPTNAVLVGGSGFGNITNSGIMRVHGTDAVAIAERSSEISTGSGSTMPVWASVCSIPES